MSEDKYKISIDKSLISQLSPVQYSGDIIVVDKPEDVAQAVDYLEQQPKLGFDTETRPSFHKGKVNNVALLQLATYDRCYLFRLNNLGLGQHLSRLLENDQVLKIGLSIHDDFNVMHRSSQVQPKGFVELQDFVKQFHISDISLQKIYAILFGQKISKSQRLTNWEAQNLTRAQQLYASTDAWACLKIYDYLNSGCFDPANSQYIVTDESQDKHKDNQ